MRADRQLPLLALLAAMVFSSGSAWAAEPIASIEGVVLTPENQQSLGVLTYVTEDGCEDPTQRFVELQYPTRFEGEPARAARLTLEGDGDESLELFVHQKRMGKGLLISNLCLTEDWLGRARLTLIYGGAGSKANLLVNDFGLWPVEQ